MLKPYLFFHLSYQNKLISYSVREKYFCLKHDLEFISTF